MAVNVHAGDWVSLGGGEGLEAAACTEVSAARACFIGINLMEMGV